MTERKKEGRKEGVRIKKLRQHCCSYISPTHLLPYTEKRRLEYDLKETLLALRMFTKIQMQSWFAYQMATLTSLKSVSPSGKRTMIEVFHVDTLVPYLFSIDVDDIQLKKIVSH